MRNLVFTPFACLLFWFFILPISSCTKATPEHVPTDSTVLVHPQPPVKSFRVLYPPTDSFNVSNYTIERDSVAKTISVHRIDSFPGWENHWTYAYTWKYWLTPDGPERIKKISGLFEASSDYTPKYSIFHHEILFDYNGDDSIPTVIHFTSNVDMLPDLPGTTDYPVTVDSSPGEYVGWFDLLSGQYVAGPWPTGTRIAISGWYANSVLPGTSETFAHYDHSHSQLVFQEIEPNGPTYTENPGYQTMIVRDAKGSVQSVIIDKTHYSGCNCDDGFYVDFQRKYDFHNTGSQPILPIHNPAFETTALLWNEYLQFSTGVTSSAGRSYGLQDKDLDMFYAWHADLSDSYTDSLFTLDDNRVKHLVRAKQFTNILTRDSQGRVVLMERKNTAGVVVRRVELTY